MRRFSTLLSVLLLVGCADDIPNPKSWTFEPEPAAATTPAISDDVVVDGELPDPMNTGLRPLFPPHGVTTPDNTPTFRWASDGGDPALLICADRWCNEPIVRQQLRVAAREVTLVDQLAPGLYWWAMEYDGQRSFSRSLVVSPTASDREVTGHWGMRADFNADGLADIAAIPTGGSLVGVAYGNREELRVPRSWQEDSIDRQSWIGTSVAAVDHDGSGVDWVAFGRPHDGALTISPDYVRGRFDVTADVGFGDVVTSVGDVNGDGFGDVAVASGGTESIYIVFGGTARQDSSVQAIYSRGRLGGAIAGPADFDEDGFSDFVTSTDDGVYLAYGGPDGIREFRFMAAPPEAGPGFGSSLGIGDVNGDGRPDFVAAESGACATVFYSADDGFGSLRNCATGEAAATTARVALVDFDGDGVDTLAMAYEEPFSRCGLRSVVLLWLRIDGNGVRVFEEDLPGARFATPGDVNGDGANDIVIVHQAELTRLDPASF